MHTDAQGTPCTDNQPVGLAASRIVKAAEHEAPHPTSDKA